MVDSRGKNFTAYVANDVDENSRTAKTNLAEKHAKKAGRNPLLGSLEGVIFKMRKQRTGKLESANYRSRRALPKQRFSSLFLMRFDSFRMSLHSAERSPLRVKWNLFEFRFLRLCLFDYSQTLFVQLPSHAFCFRLLKIVLFESLIMKT